MDEETQKVSCMSNRIYRDVTTAESRHMSFKAPAGVETAELAPWPVVSIVLLNLDEVLTKR